MKGTKSYLDPIYKKHYSWCKEKTNKLVEVKSQPVVDLFKADIFSLGVTFYKAVTGCSNKDIEHINESQEEQEKCYDTLHKLKIPLSMKQAISHMIQFEADNRIPIFSLYNNL